MSSPSGVVAGMERHQVAVYVGALAAGGLVGRAAPGAGPGLEHAINPVLAALLYVTFLQVPAAELFRSVRAGRFLAATLVVNFVVVPLVVAAMFTFLPDDRAVRLGVLLVLLAPCIDYVIVFSGLAGAAANACSPPPCCCSSPRWCCCRSICSCSWDRTWPTWWRQDRSSRRSSC